MSARGKIVCVSGPAAGRELEIEREIVVGRVEGDLVVGDDQMSSRHAVLRPVDGGVEVDDLGSLNGTFVDGRKVEAPTLVAIRGLVRMGASEFEVEVSLPQTTRLSAQAPPQFAKTVVGRAPAIPGPPAGEHERDAAPSIESRVESPHLPIPVSIGIFTAATVAVVLILIFTR